MPNGGAAPAAAIGKFGFHHLDHLGVIKRCVISGLTTGRIDAVVALHSLDPKGSEAATAFALDVIKMILERHLTPSETACGLELLSHLRKDKCI
jgi:hypothetical protein